LDFRLWRAAPFEFRFSLSANASFLPRKAPLPMGVVKTDLPPASPAEFTN